ncbi:MAG: hypothetical protein ACPGC9_00925 [Cytophagales bacterium]
MQRLQKKFALWGLYLSLTALMLTNMARPSTPPFSLQNMGNHNAFSCHALTKEEKDKIKKSFDEIRDKHPDEMENFKDYQTKWLPLDIKSHKIIQELHQVIVAYHEQAPEHLTQAEIITRWEARVKECEVLFTSIMASINNRGLVKLHSDEATKTLLTVNKAVKTYLATLDDRDRTKYFCDYLERTEGNFNKQVLKRTEILNVLSN